tara:strand:+ start:5370 stop:6182 length:813 start_codon:yes stop_codon:yes gene_type:complete
MGILDQTPTSGRTTGVFAPSIADYLEHFQDRNNAWKSRNAPTYQQTGVTPNIVAQDEQGLSIVGDQILAPQQYRDPFKPDQGEGDGWSPTRAEMPEGNPLTAPTDLRNAGMMLPGGSALGAGLGSYLGSNAADKMGLHSTGINPNISALGALTNAMSFGLLGTNLTDQYNNFLSEASTFPDGGYPTSITNPNNPFNLSPLISPNRPIPSYTEVSPNYPRTLPKYLPKALPKALPRAVNDWTDSGGDDYGDYGTGGMGDQSMGSFGGLDGF